MASKLNESQLMTWSIKNDSIVLLFHLLKNGKQKNDPKQGTLTEREGSVHLTSVY